MSNIKREDVITASGAYPERLKNPELTKEVIANIDGLTPKVNAMLAEVGIKSAKVSSGFRPSNVNANTPGAAKKSNHMTGNALDILDSKMQTIAKLVLGDNFDDETLLEKYDLYAEHPSVTKGKNSNWFHVQDKATRSGKRIFYP